MIKYEADEAIANNPRQSINLRSCLKEPQINRATGKKIILIRRIAEK